MDVTFKTWKERAWRWRRWILLLAAIVLVRASLPVVLRRVLVSQASQLLKARVELGNLALHLLSGGVVLTDFAIYVENRNGPPTGGRNGGTLPRTAPAIGEPATEGAPTATRPIIAWKSLAVDVHWLPLTRRTVQFGAIVLESPRIALDRLESGHLNVEDLLRAAMGPSAETQATSGATATPQTPAPADAASAAEAVPTASPSAESTPVAAADRTPKPEAAAATGGWRIGIDRLDLRDGGIRFRDLMLKESEPLDVAIPAIQVADIALSPDVYGKPIDFHLRAAVDEASLDLAARAQLSGSNLSLDCALKAQGLPLHRTRLYIPQVGWSDLRGELDTDVSYRLETGTTNELRGTITLRDLSVTVPELPEAALFWKSLLVRVDPLDLAGRNLGVAEVDLSGAWVAVRPQSSDQLPVLERRRKRNTAPDTAGAATGAEAKQAAAGAGPGATDAAASRPAPDEQPWHWSVASLRIADSYVRVLGSDAPLDVSVALNVADLAGASDSVANVQLALGVGSGSLHVDGKTRVAPPGFGGMLKVTALSLPELIAISGALPQNPIRSATLDADLAVEAGLAGDAAGDELGPYDLRARGTVTLHDAHVLNGDTTVRAGALDMKIAELSLPGALGPKAATTAVSPSALAGDLRFRGELSLTSPEVTLGASAPLALAAHSLAVTISELSLLGLLTEERPGSPTPSNRGDLHFQGDLTVAAPEVKLPELGDLRIAAQSVGVSKTDIAVAALLGGGSAASDIGTRADAGNLRVKGDLAIAQPRLALGDGRDFLVSFGALDLGIADMNVPGALAAMPAGPAQPLRVALRDLKLDAPSIRLTRTKDGIVLPGASKPAAAAPQKAEAAAPPPSDAGGGIDFSLGSIRINKGRLAVTDRTLTPTFSAALADIQLAARDIRVPKLAVKQMRFGVTTPEEGEIELSGDVVPDGAALQLEGRDVALTPYNPYAAAFSPYRIASGALQLSTLIKSEGKHYDVRNEITLQDFDVEGGKGESVFEQQFGIPLTMGLALLRDVEGNINLNVPVQIGDEETKIDVWAVVGGALRSALLGALTGPLRLVGSLVGGGDKVGAFTPAPITFQPGRAELTAESAKGLERMAGFLASRPAMGVELQAAVTQADQRWLHEQALLQHWQEQGFLGRVRTLTQRGTRDRVESALQARAKDESAELSAEDAQALDQWLEAIPMPSPQQLQDLAAARLAKAATTLRGDKGIDDSRLTLGEPSAELAEGAPEVKIQLKPLKRLHAAAGSGSPLP